MTIPITPSTLGAQIRARRVELGLTRAELADFAGISESYLGALESGSYTNPTITILQILGAELKCNFLIEAGPYSAQD